MYTTSITLAEIRYGIERLPADSHKNQLSATAAEVFSAFADHVLPFDAEAAAVYAVIVSRRARAGTPVVGFDAQISSICRTRHATLATRNVKGFDNTGIEVIDPWQNTS